MNAEPERSSHWLPLTITAGVAIFLFYLVADSLTPIILATIMAYLLNPLVDFGERLSLPRWLAIAIIYLTIGGILALTIFVLVPIVVEQFRELYIWAQTYGSLQPEHFAATIGAMVDRIPFVKDFPAGTSLGERSLAAANEWLKGLLEKSPALITSALSNLFNIVTYFGMVPFIAFFFLRDGRQFKRAFIELIPNRYFETTLSIIAGVTDSVGRYLRGVLLEALALGIMATTGLLIIDLQGAVVVGMIAGFMNLIPYVGAAVGVLIGSFVALASGGSVIAVIIVFAAAQFLDNWIVQPVVLSRSVNLHPLVIFLAVVFGGTYGGLLGMVLAVPLTGAAVVTFRTCREGLRPPVLTELVTAEE